jgi:hypothetical protein
MMKIKIFTTLSLIFGLSFSMDKNLNLKIKTLKKPSLKILIRIKTER